MYVQEGEFSRFFCLGWRGEGEAGASRSKKFFFLFNPRRCQTEDARGEVRWGMWLCMQIRYTYFKKKLKKKKEEKETEWSSEAYTTKHIHILHTLTIFSFLFSADKSCWISIVWTSLVSGIPLFFFFYFLILFFFNPYPLPYIHS